MNQLIEAIYKLIEVEASTNLRAIIISEIFAVICSIAAVFIVDALRKKPSQHFAIKRE